MYDVSFSGYVVRKTSLINLFAWRKKETNGKHLSRLFRCDVAHFDSLCIVRIDLLSCNLLSTVGTQLVRDEHLAFDNALKAQKRCQ